MNILFRHPRYSTSALHVYTSFFYPRAETSALLTQTSLFTLFVDCDTAALRQQSFNSLRIHYSSTAALRQQSFNYFNCVILLGHCGTAAARNLCCSKWAGYSAIAPKFERYACSYSLLYLSNDFLVLKVRHCHIFLEY